MLTVYHQQNTIKETFTLRDVPQRALYVGLAGVMPYLATSLATVYLSFDIQYAANHGQGFMMSGEVAEALLHILEPIQLGYGATVSSFGYRAPKANILTILDHLIPRRHPLGS